MRPTAGRAYRSWRAAVAVLGATTALLAAGCSAGQITGTDTQVAVVNGDQASVGQLRISNAVLPYPDDDQHHLAAGSDVELSLSIANNGGSADELQAVSTPLADEVTISGDTVIPSQGGLTVGQGEPEDGDVGSATIVLNGISSDRFPGQVTDVTMVFADAGSIDLRVPIGPPEHARTEEPDTAEGGGH